MPARGPKARIRRTWRQGIVLGFLDCRPSDIAIHCAGHSATGVSRHGRAVRASGRNRRRRGQHKEVPHPGTAEAAGGRGRRGRQPLAGVGATRGERVRHPAGRGPLARDRRGRRHRRGVHRHVAVPARAGHHRGPGRRQARTLRGADGDERIAGPRDARDGAGEPAAHRPDRARAAHARPRPDHRRDDRRRLHRRSRGGGRPRHPRQRIPDVGRPAALAPQPRSVRQQHHDDGDLVRGDDALGGARVHGDRARAAGGPAPHGRRRPPRGDGDPGPRRRALPHGPGRADAFLDLHRHRPRTADVGRDPRHRRHPEGRGGRRRGVRIRSVGRTAPEPAAAQNHDRAPRRPAAGGSRRSSSTRCAASSR